MAHGGVGVIANPCTTPLNLGAVREALTATLEGALFDGQPLRVNAWLADTLNPPCALIGTPSITFRDDSYAGLTTCAMPVRLVVPVPSLRTAQQDLDDILGVYASALDADTTLNGVVRSVLALTAQPVATVRGNQELPSYECNTLIIL